MPRTKTTTIEEDLELLRRGCSISVSSSNEDDFDIEVPKLKKKRLTKSKSNAKPKVKKDVRTDILAEWNDESDEEPSTNNMDVDTTIDSKNTTLNQSSFDFVEDNEISPSTSRIGKKISRVSPEKHIQSNSSKSGIDKNISLTLESKDSDKSPDISAQETSNLDSQKSDGSASTDESSFKEILEKTNPITIPDIPELSKLENHFPNTRPAKTLDKTDAHPKKRFVKSFEDFELFLKNQMKNENKPKEIDVEQEEEHRGKNYYFVDGFIF